MIGSTHDTTEQPTITNADKKEQNDTLTEQSILNSLRSPSYHTNRVQVHETIHKKLINLQQVQEKQLIPTQKDTQDTNETKQESTDINTEPTHTIATQTTSTSKQPKSADECASIITTSLPRIFIDLAMLNNDAFDSENEYLDSLEALFYTRFMIHDCETYKHSQFYNAIMFHNSIKRNQQKILQSSLRILDELYQQMYLKICHKLKAHSVKHGRLPRIERLIQKYKFTAKEADAFRYITILNGGMLFPKPQMVNGGITSNSAKRKFNSNLSIAAQMNTTECINFFSGNRKHLKEGMVENAADGRAPKMSKRVLSSLYHCKMSADELLMLHSTALGEVLSEEGITPTQLKVSNANRKSNKKYESKLMKQKGDKTVVQVLDLLKMSNISGGNAVLGNGVIKVKSDKPMQFESITNPKDTVLEQKMEQKIVENVDKDSEVKNEIQSILQPYTSNLDYLQDHFEVIGLKFRLQSCRDEDQFDAGMYGDAYAQQQKQRAQSSKRELNSKLTQALKKCQVRLEATYDNVKETKVDESEEKKLSSEESGELWLPRVEILKRELGLVEFEKWALLTLVGKVLSADVRKQIRGYTRAISVEVLLALHCPDLKEQISKRKYFYKGATLLKEGIITMNETGIGTNIMTSVLDIDRRMVDYCVELDTEFEALVEGSILFTPTVTLDRVVLPKETKEKIIKRVENLDELQKAQAKYGFVEHGYGNGLCLLFHGMSGTGKTLMANAIANHLGKKILLANFPTLRIAHASHKTDNGVRDTFRYVFREAKIQNAIVFFDECESLFQTREIKSAMSEVNTALSCIEQYDDVIIMATNRPYDLDEAMYRRIHMVIEFSPPDIHMRRKIWQKHIPPSLPMTDDVDIAELAIKFELTGGFIKNAVQSAMQSALLRDKENLEITHRDLLRACEEQIMGQLQLTGFGNDERVLPRIKLSELCLKPVMRKQCTEIINLLKAKKVLSGSWGFKEIGTRILLIGKAGCGKSSIAEAIAFECGKPMKVISCATMLVSSGQSMRTVHSQSHHLSWSKIFSETNTGALFVVRNCELLFSSMVGLGTLGYICHQMKRAKSTFIFIFDGQLSFGDIEHLNALQKGLLHLFQFVLRFEKPSQQMRVDLWKQLIPKETPNDLEQKDFVELSHKYYEFVQSDIISTIHMGAAKACLRSPKEECLLRMKDLISAANAIQKKRMTQDFKGIMYT